ncbi:MAG: hypothetical protein KBD63_01355 [Bacteriovoracaceae bacterium]|nr:hypothetical protein [Bacteriovoracaceae bacterium]
MSLQDKEIARRIYLLLKIDARTLFNRISSRSFEIVEIFASKRTRDHLKDIFRNRYEETSVHELKNCSEEVIQALNEFYTEMDNLRWYLQYSTDMPTAIEAHLLRVIHLLELHLQNLESFIDKEIFPEDLPSDQNMS